MRRAAVLAAEARGARWALIALFALGNGGCWVQNPDYLAPPGAADGAGGADLAPPGDALPSEQGPLGGPEVLVPSGTFDMQGVPVMLADFYLDVHEVTVREYRACASANSSGCSTPGSGAKCNWGAAGRDDHPINCVSLQQAREYCRWVGRRLPTEAEWEYAAGGGASLYPWGDAEPLPGDSPARLCWYHSTSGGGGTCPVGRYPATLRGRENSGGAADLAGNVAEWTDSQHATPYVHPAPPCTSACSIRGGAFSNSNLGSLRAGGRMVTAAPTDSLDAIGLRCARSR